MARTRKPNASEASLTTAQQLGSIVKSCRDIMRKDKGLNGDLDRLPMLTWMMFLKFLDDMEQHPGAGGDSGGRAVPPGHRAALPLAGLGGERQRQDGMPPATATTLIAFINNDEAMRPDGARRPGALRLPAQPAGRQRWRPAGCDCHGLPGHRQPHDQRLPAARCDQQGQRASTSRSSDEIHTLSAPLRVDAQGDAGRGGRLRRVLHAAAGDPLHGRR